MGWRIVVLQVGFDRFVLLVKMCHIRDEVLDDVHVRKRIDLDWCRRFLVDSLQASQGVSTIDVHGAATTDALSTTPSESERRIDFIFDLDKGIKDHGATLLQVDRVGLQGRLLARFVWVPAID